MNDEIDIKTPKILYVDDLEENQLVLKIILEKEGYKVYAALTGQEALRMVLKERYDLFILDVQMPGMDGFELAEHLKGINRTKDIPIIFLTSMTKEMSLVKKGLKLGAVDFMSKPIDDELLKLKVKTFLQLHLEHIELLKTKQKLNKANKSLEETVEELKTTLEGLKITQSQLVQSEKMAGIGQLIAGIAHEINNPVGFIQASSFALDKDLKDIFELVGKYRDYIRNGQKNQNEIAEFEKKIDVEFLLKTLLQEIEDIKEGTNRTSEIVKSLREFSHEDKAEMEPGDIHRAIDNTLGILKNRLKENVKISRNYDQSISMINCYIGQLSQVFMNLLNNAIDSIEDKGTIKISTVKTNQHIEIRIEDTGTGLADDIRDKIFDPFFTTKEIGKGMGLGLSIVYGIIEKHGGKIMVISEIGKGSEFTIHLPVN